MLFYIFFHLVFCFSLVAGNNGGPLTGENDKSLFKLKMVNEEVIRDNQGEKSKVGIESAPIQDRIPAADGSPGPLLLGYCVVQ